MMNINEEQVRKHAYQIWESEGRPQNQAIRHWEMAQKIAASQNQLEHQDRSKTSKAKARSVAAPGSNADIATVGKKIKTRQREDRALEKADAIANTEVVKDVIKTEVPPVNSHIGV